VRTIYIDSRFRDVHSNSNTDFRIHLQEAILMPDHTSMFVTDICIPHCWYTIEYYNKFIYFRNFVGDNFTDYIFPLPEQNYDISTLPEALVTAMNTAVGGLLFQKSIDITKGQITITGTNANVRFYIFSDRDLATRVSNTWSGPSYSASNPMSCNSVLSHSRDYTGTPHSSSNPFQTGFVDVITNHNIYICSPSFGNNSLGPRGEHNVLKKVVTSAGFGELITDALVNEFDSNDCSTKMFQQMEFQITDSYGNPLVLHGGHCSVTLAFVSN